MGFIMKYFEEVSVSERAAIWGQLYNNKELIYLFDLDYESDESQWMQLDKEMCFSV